MSFKPSKSLARTPVSKPTTPKNDDVQMVLNDQAPSTSRNHQSTIVPTGDKANERAKGTTTSNTQIPSENIKHTHAMSLRSGRVKTATFYIPDRVSCPGHLPGKNLLRDQGHGYKPAYLTQLTGPSNAADTLSFTSTHTRSSQQLILQQMEDIRKLERIQENRDIEFAKQKLHLLQQQEESCGGTSRCRSVVKSNSNLNRTFEWVQSARNEDTHHVSNLQNEQRHIASKPSVPCPIVKYNDGLQIPPRKLMNERSIQNHVYDTVFKSQLGEQSVHRQHNMRSTPFDQQHEPSQQVEQIPKMSSWNIQPVSPMGNIPLAPEQVVSRMAFSSKDLPSFNGNPLEWPKFISNYVFTTQQCGFTNVDNLGRLQRALKPPASDLVRNRLIVPESVPAVIEKLRTHYGRPELVIRALTQQVRNLPPVKTDKYSSLIHFASEVDNLCGLAEASQLQSHLNDATLLEELTEKLPYHLGIDWGNYSKRFDVADLSRFSHWLNDVTEGAVKVSKMDLSKFLPSENKSKNKSGHKPTIGINSHVVDTTNSKNSKCVICSNDEHFLTNCEKFLAMNNNQRWDLIKKNRWCGKCIKPHNFKSCKNKQRCNVDGCNRAHHFLLHKGDNNPASTVSSPPVNNAETQPVMKINLHSNAEREILFRIVPVVLYGENGKQLQTYAFLDEGSNGTIMEEWVADHLGLRGPKIDVCLQWTKEITTMEEGSMCVSPRISGVDTDAEQYTLEYVRTAKSLALPCQSLPVGSLPQYIEELPIKQYQHAKPTILIGSDEAWLIVPTEARQNGRNSPIATKTKLGWAVYGKHDPQTIESYRHDIKSREKPDEQLHDLVEQFYALDTYGIGQNRMLESKEIVRSHEILAKTTTYTGERFRCGLLWKFDDVQLPNSSSMALRRLYSFETKLLKNPELGQKINDLIQSYIQKRYIRQLQPSETVMKSRSWYLPIFSVQNPNKPNKVRLVWDAAAKVDGISLNAMLMKGPDELAPLPSVLFKFRQEKIAISGDIMEMFHQIEVTEPDADSQRFYWRNLDTSRKPDTYIMRVMTFGATCSPAIAQHIKNSNAEEFATIHPRAAEAIQNRHYVDDWLDSFPSVEEAIQVVQQVTNIHQHAGFKIRGWISNSKELLRAIGVDVKERDHEICDKGTIGDKVLGMWWDHKNDQFRFSLNANRIEPSLLDGTKSPTKREVLKILMSVFDPLGLISNFLMYGKLILQDIWRSGIDWDDPINDEQNDKWKNWTKQLSNINQFSVPRCYDLGPRPAKHQLHIFTDASQYVYAAVAYIRTTSSDGISTALVASKTRVAPNNKLISIPRLELMAAVLGVRLSSTVIDSHSIDFESKHYWTDSKTVVSWLKSDARNYRQFVAFRITECLEKSTEREWHWLSGKQNVADEATKWLNNAPSFEPDSRWVNGPPFLLEPEENWPITTTEESATTEEYRLNHHQIESAASPMAINPNNCSTWALLIGAQMKFNRSCRILLSTIKRAHPVRGPITFKEVRRAHNDLVRYAQWDEYQKEIILLHHNNNKGVDRDSKIYKYSPYLDEDGILRVRGRIDAATCVPYETKRKIILPRNHRITYLRVHEFHVLFAHQNNETVYCQLRQKYEISRLRTLIRQVQYDCPVCKERRAKPIPPEMSPLPPARLAAYCRPFSYVGIDFFGPMTVTVGRRSEKRWGVVFTCMTIRAIHLEISPSLSTDSFIQSFLRFRARRGNPLEVFTDNGTNFKGAARELREELQKLDEKEVQNQLTTFMWTFIPPSSPHFGGAWERMVRTVKSNLYKVLSNVKLTDEILQTSFAEVENIINTRPLTYLPANSDDDTLTPNHFLLGASSGCKPLAVLDPSAKTVYKNWLVTQQIANHFWKRWVAEYLPLLTKRTKWFERAEPLAIGDVVIVIDERNSRGSWPKGVIVDVNKGKENQVRSAVIKTPTGLFTRPATKLAKLDIRGENSDKPEHSPWGSVTDESTRIHLHPIREDRSGYKI